jgi:hypothetical protein
LLLRDRDRWPEGGLQKTPPACIQAGETNRDEAMVSIHSAQLFSALRKIVVALRVGDL